MMEIRNVYSSRKEEEKKKEKNIPTFSFFIGVNNETIQRKNEKTFIVYFGHLSKFR